jgi:sugar phosphate isomerase/epimerase
VHSDLHSAMKVGIVHFMAYPQAVKGEQVVETMEHIAEDDFFGAIEVTSIKDPATRAAAARLLEASGLTVGYGAQIVELNEKLDINSVDEKKRADSVARLRLAVDEARELGAKRFAVLSGPFPGEEQHSAATRALVLSLDELCDYATSTCGLPVVLEVFDRTIDKKSLIGPTAEAVALSAELRKRHPTFGLMIDLSHLPLQFETPKESLGIAAGHVVHAHIGNCVLKNPGHPLYGDLHPRFGVEGGENGIAEVTDFLRELMAIGYIGEGKQNIVAFEVKPFGAETSGAVVAQAKRTLREAWARL